MAVKPTIYKLRIALSDLERHYYDALNLTIALHPSETPERMVARVLAFCLNAQSDLSFTKGLSAIEEPDVWVKLMDDTVDLWIDVGEPSVERVKKASRQANNVMIYSFNSKSDVWWDQSRSKLKFPNVSIMRFDYLQIETLASHLERTSDWSVTVSGQSAYITTSSGEVDVSWQILMGNT